MRKIYGIQWLRAVASILVVAFHSAGRWNVDFRFGNAGVDIFFVISGFIMWTVAEAPIRPLNFLRDRIVRIVPLYWFATIGMAVGGILGLYPHLAVHTIELIKSLLFIPYLNDGVHIWPLLVPGWTLNYEMYFYAIFSILILLKGTPRLVALLAIFSSVVIAGAITQPTNVFLRFYSNSIVLEFAFGAVLGWCFSRFTVRHSLVGGALIAVAVVMFCLIAISPWRDIRPLGFGVPAALVVSGTIALEQSGIQFRAKPMTFLGDASYSIYLFHVFAVSLAVRFLPHRHDLIDTILAIITAIVFGSLAHRFIERPLANLLKQRKPRPDAEEIVETVLRREA